MDDIMIKDDPRFAHILSDPKFRVMPKSKKKVKIDSRFRSVFSSEHFSHKTDIDKRGRPIFDAATRNRHVMKRFYQLSESESESGDQSESGEEVTRRRHSEQDGKPKRSKVTDDQNSQEFNDSQTQPPTHDPAPITRSHTHDPAPITRSHTPADRNSSRKKGKPAASRRDVTLSKKSSSGADATSLPQSEDEDSSTVDEDDDEEEEEEEEDADLPEFSQDYALEETEIDHKWNELHTDATAVVESTRRLAVCNMDWDFVKAQDLFVLFKSFVPDGGRVKSVTIYPSEFGKERMAEEARLGPREIREHKSQESLKAADREGQSCKKNRATHQQQLKRANKDLEASQTEKLREYQLNRLRYYFAVVDCDSVVTAETIYNECDGREYLLSSVQLDLRFIPDGMTFDDPPREMFSQDQSILEYEPNQFSSTALCQAKVDVTWDETEFDRLSRRMGAMQHKELESIVEENKYADIIAPPESDSDQDMDDQPDWLKQVLSSEDRELTEEEKIAMYRQLLMDKLDEEDDDDGDEKGREGEKELVWKPGLKSSLVKRMEKKERQRENTGVVNDYLDKKKEKKKKKKEDRVKKRTANEKEQADIFDNNVNENVEAVSSTQPKKKKKKQKMRGLEDDADTKHTADLELLVMGDHDDDVKDAHADKHTSSNKKGKKLKMKKKKLAEVRDEFQLDMNDPRFAAVYTSQHFHIDPSSAQFKKSTNMTALMNEQIKRRGHPGKPETQTGSKPGHSDEHSGSLSRALVESIKLKMKK